MASEDTLQQANSAASVNGSLAKEEMARRVEKHESSPFEAVHIPMEIWTMVLLHCDAATLQRAQMVCKRWKLLHEAIQTRDKAHRTDVIGALGLPTELWCEIVRYCDTPTLRRLLPVSKWLATIVRTALWRRTKRETIVKGLYDGYPGPRGVQIEYITHCTIFLPTPPFWGEQVSVQALLPLLARMPRLEWLELYGAQEDSSWTSPESRSRLRELASSSVSILKWVVDCRRSTVASLMSFLPHVTDLIILLDHEKDLESDAPIHAPQLQRLVFSLRSNHQPAVDFAHYFSQETLGGLRTFVLLGDATVRPDNYRYLSNTRHLDLRAQEGAWKFDYALNYFNSHPTLERLTFFIEKAALDALDLEATPAYPPLCCWDEPWGDYFQLRIERLSPTERRIWAKTTRMEFDAVLRPKAQPQQVQQQ